MGNKTPLRMAVENLKENGIIASQKELMSLFGQNNEGNLAKIINSTNPNKELIKKFEQKFGLKLLDFDNKSDIKKLTTYQDRFNALVLEEIASLKANIKGSLAADELSSLKVKVMQL